MSYGDWFTYCVLQEKDGNRRYFVKINFTSYRVMSTGGLQRNSLYTSTFDDKIYVDDHVHDQIKTSGIFKIPVAHISVKDNLYVVDNKIFIHGTDFGTEKISNFDRGRIFKMKDHRDIYVEVDYKTLTKLKLAA